MKKVFVTALGVCTMLSLVTIPTPVQATDFSGQEDKYMKLCSSSNLSTNNLNTCKEFNTYLKNKNKELKSQVSDSKSKVSDTQNSLNSISSEISALNDQIAEKQKEIEAYFGHLLECLGEEDTKEYLRLSLKINQIIKDLK